MSIEAMKQALEALEAHADIGINSDKAITAIKEALAQPVSSHGNAEDLYIEMSKHLNCPHCGGSGHVDDVAQPEQEPVAWSWEKDGRVVNAFPFKPNADDAYWKEKGWTTRPLVFGDTTPPQRKPLTNEEKYVLIEKHLGLKKRRNDTVIDQYTGLFYAAKPYLDLIDEAAHGIKE